MIVFVFSGLFFLERKEKGLLYIGVLLHVIILTLEETKQMKSNDSNYLFLKLILSRNKLQK